MSTKTDFEKVRDVQPLVHIITNYVTINDVANITLSVGASPAMVESREEVSEFVSLASALYVNIGTLNHYQKASIYTSMRKATELGKPIVLDPVGCAAITSRQALIFDLLDRFKVTCLRGNIAEIKTLAGKEAMGKGVDSLDSGEFAREAAEALSQRFNTLVAATGKEDYIVDGQQGYVISNGSPLFGQMTGAGCMLGAVVGAFLGSLIPVDKPHKGTEKTRLEAVKSACSVFGVVGELAEESIAQKTDTGSFKVKVLDQARGLSGKVAEEKEEVNKIG